MLVFCINLPSRPEKWQQAKAECERIGLHALRVNAIAMSPGFDGCRKSHLKVLQQAKPPFMLLEDDVLFTGDLKQLEQCMSDLPPDWDMLYLGANLQAPIEKYSDNLYRLKDAYTTHAIIYNSQRVIDYIIEHDAGGRKIDVFYANDVQHKFNVYATRPMLATQRAGFSDIMGCYTEYEALTESYKVFAK
jgi:GR25 family glycosyltransferase involved in LPS biosynthesis